MRATALHKISFLLITFFYLSQPVFADDWNKLSPYLPHDGVIQGDVLKRVPSEKIKAIESKLFKAYMSKPKWFDKHTQDKGRKEPLPYHANLGLSKKEYEVYAQLTRSMSSIAYEKTGNIELKFKKMSKGDLIIDSDNASFPLNGLNYTVDNNSVKSQHGELTTFSNINRPPDLDKKWWFSEGWDGLSWRRNVVIGSFGDKDLGPYLCFSIGKLKNKNVGLIMYEAIHVGDSVKKPYIIKFHIKYPLND